MARKRPPLRLSDAWRAWLLENLARGVKKKQLVRVLREAGVEKKRARREIAALRGVGAVAAYQLARRQAEQQAQVLRLLRAHQRMASGVERRPKPSADVFFDGYYAEGRPVVLTDAMEGWPALERWTPARLAARFADLEVEVCDGRASNAAPDKNFAQLSTRMPMAAFLERVEAESPTNDLYLIAQNRGLERPELRGLFDDVKVDEALFDPERVVGSSSLWIGPAGTVTPLHHDTCNILFHQVRGRKRFHLVSPLETELIEGADGFYAAPGAMERVSGAVREVVLEPGEALFIPAGWWHRVEALDVSVSFSLLCFRRPNRFDHYRPGARAARERAGPS